MIQLNNTKTKNFYIVFHSISENTQDKDTKIGHLLCKACGITFQTVTNVLTEPVDVYSDWIDACNALDKKNKTMDDFVEDDEQINRAGSPNDNDLVSNDSDEDL
ncbi:hypothetical protein HK099_007855 [Clydaea vesicula]|uniref:Transcription elongation factor 1 homolog n=1 Tax=Clydaea vesicula TaxID=447962 RepID=A0AAD5U7Y7_9FUNG|nr:hypothetical protein HK099_007855 [Clydaea vesicula]